MSDPKTWVGEDLAMPADPRIRWLCRHVPHFKDSYEASQAVKAEEAENRARFGQTEKAGALDA